jgi:hypothetical protein
MCSGVRLLKEQEIKSKCQRRNTTEHQQSIFNQQCRGRAEIPEVISGDVQRGPVAEGTGNQKQMSEAQHNTTSAERFHSTMQV